MPADDHERRGGARAADVSQEGADIRMRVGPKGKVGHGLETAEHLNRRPVHHRDPSRVADGHGGEGLCFQQVLEPAAPFGAGQGEQPGGAGEGGPEAGQLRADRSQLVACLGAGVEDLARRRDDHGVLVGLEHGAIHRVDDLQLKLDISRAERRLHEQPSTNFGSTRDILAESDRSDSGFFNSGAHRSRLHHPNA